MINPIEIINDEFVDLNCFNIIKDLYQINRSGIIIDKQKNESPKVFTDTGGYLFVNLKTYNGFIPFRIHRLVSRMFVVNENLNEYNIVNHRNGIKDDNYYSNLEWTDESGNRQHAIEMGLVKIYGEDNNMAKLTNNQVHLICKLLEENLYTYSDILKQVNLEDSKQNLDLITKIRTKKLWSHISDNYNIPDKESRSIQNQYTDEEIHLICKLLEQNNSIREIAEKLNIDISNKKNIDKWWHFIKRIKERKTYTNISINYNF